jgi:very-short-patch-repair endonuclease
MNAFEEDVYGALTRRGIPLTPQLGVSRFRIDFAAQHREQSGRFVLAIECDGASYHSMPTTRDRDRLRQQHLQALGWRFHRIWSTDWFMRKAEEIERALLAYETALAQADQGQPLPVPARATAAQADRPHASPPPAPARAAPAIPKRPSIVDYSDHEIDTVVRWVGADGRLRTDDELVEEARAALGFERRGKRIEAAIRKAVDRTKAGSRT